MATISRSSGDNVASGTGAPTDVAFGYGSDHTLCGGPDADGTSLATGGDAGFGSLIITGSDNVPFSGPSGFNSTSHWAAVRFWTPASSSSEIKAHATRFN